MTGYGRKVGYIRKVLSKAMPYRGWRGIKNLQKELI